MDYTKNEDLMKLLTEVSREIEGFNYSINRNYSEYSEVINQRRETINTNIEKLKRVINTL